LLHYKSTTVLFTLANVYLQLYCLRVLTHELKELTHELKELTHELKELTHELKELTHELKELTHELKKILFGVVKHSDNNISYTCVIKLYIK